MVATKGAFSLEPSHTSFPPRANFGNGSLCAGAHSHTMDASDPPRGLSGGAVLAFLSFVNMWNYIVRSHHMLLHSFFLPY